MADDKINPYHLLLLSSVPGIGALRVRNLIARFKTPEAVFKASTRELVQVEGIENTLAQNIKDGGDPDFAADQMRRLEQSDVRMLTYWDPEYPGLLKKIFDPPTILFVRGNLQALNRQAIAVVGTRSPSFYGKMMTERLVRDIAQQNLTVISGLARGIDTVAHRVALECNGTTIAVLGSAVDSIYPEENTSLTLEIAKNGAVISELPMGTTPEAHYFPRRNRIISGMSIATLVMEAGATSGALITAYQALEQNRDVFAVPGNVNNPKSQGCNLLIQQGAKLVQTAKDIFEELSLQMTSAATADSGIIPTSLSTEEEKVFTVLSHEPLHIDRIAARCGIPTYQALGHLLAMELKNCIKQLPGKNFVRI